MFLQFIKYFRDIKQLPKRLEKVPGGTLVALGKFWPHLMVPSCPQGSLASGCVLLRNGSDPEEELGAHQNNPCKRWGGCW